MGETYKIVESLNLKGLLCPLPVVKVAKAVKGINIGDAIEAIATDPGVMMDIPAWCKGSGNELVKMDKGEGEFIFIVRRVK